MYIDKIKDEFLENVSCDLREPLNGIIGLAEILADNSRNLGEESLENAHAIASSGKRLYMLVSDLLDYIRLKNNNIILNRQLVDMYSLVNGVVEMMNIYIARKDIYLINHVDGNIPLINADEQRIQQVLFNLLWNAITYSKRGEIIISSEQGTQDVSSGTVTIVVKDHGCGITRERMQCIIDALAREEKIPTDANEISGSGMGLLIVKQLVELHGGTMSIMSQSGDGVCVRFSLPVGNDINAGRQSRSARDKADVEVSRSISHAKEEVGSGSDSEKPAGRILVIDDDAVTCRVISQYLQNSGYVVTTTTEPEQGLALSRENHFDIILIDVLMPRKTGYDICGELRKSITTQDIPVILLTTNKNFSGIKAVYDSGANDFISKPVDRNELLVRVGNVITLRHEIVMHRESQYKLLQERLSPHFLFNALNTIHALIGKKPGLATDALLQLAHVCRYLIEHSFMSLVSFNDEWQFSLSYLEIEKIRFSDSLTITFKMEGDFENVKIPPVTIQPIIENAIKHGIRPMGGNGSLHVNASCKDTKVMIEVRDTGIGIQNNTCGGRSLSNIARRLNYHFYEASLEIGNQPAGGACARIAYDSRTRHLE